MTATPRLFEGSPADIGAEVFCQVVMPIIRQSSHQLSANDLALVYIGFIGAAYGSMAADFGQPTANVLILDMAKTMSESAPLAKEPLQ